MYKKLFPFMQDEKRLAEDSLTLYIKPLCFLCKTKKGQPFIFISRILMATRTTLMETKMSVAEH